MHKSHKYSFNVYWLAMSLLAVDLMIVIHSADWLNRWRRRQHFDLQTKQSTKPMIMNEELMKLPSSSFVFCVFISIYVMT